MGRNILLITIMTLVICISCSGKGGDPVTPDIDRTFQVFTEPIEIFGPSTSGTEFINDLQPFYHDVDLGNSLCMVRGTKPAQNMVVWR